MINDFEEEDEMKEVDHKLLEYLKGEYKKALKSEDEGIDFTTADVMNALFD